MRELLAFANALAKGAVPRQRDRIGAMSGLKLNFTPAQVANLRAGLPPNGAPMIHPAVMAQLAAAVAPMQAASSQPRQRTPLHRGQASGQDSAFFGVDSGSVAIGAGLSATISVQPQEKCVPLTMSLAEPTAEAFLIGAISVGVMPIFITTGNISAAVFVQNSTAPMFKRYMLNVGKLFSVTVTNISGAGARFAATVIAENHEENGAYT
jgi:hypothetical protein